MIQEVGAFDAKNRFGTLLDWVETGQEVLVDAPVALAWVFADEGTDRTEALFDRMGETAANAPGLWAL